MIYYFCPNHDVPSWGIGMLYYHVSFFKKNNIDACILHNKRCFKLSWLELNVPIQYIEDKPSVKKSDIMVVPDFYVEDGLVMRFNCRKILFVQNSFILFERIKPSVLNKLGYEAAFYYMPHLKKIMSAYFEGTIYETPPFIADYYFKEVSVLHERKKEIIIYPKTESRDYNVLKNLLHDSFQPSGSLIERFFKKDKEKAWKITELKSFSHAQVADVMKRAAFFICLNTHEAFNSAVPEAMAAGCINFTYDAFGPADFLENEKNAFVFNNNHVFDLFEKLIFYTSNYDNIEVRQQIEHIRTNAYITAGMYQTSKAEKTIVNIFMQLLN